MKKIYYLLLSINLFLTFSSFIPTQNKVFTYSYCEREFDQCMKKCTVVLNSGSTITMGSYVKVYIGKELITEGYILKHMSSKIFILKNKSDAKNPEVCGGCCGEAYEINYNKKQIWGC